MTNYFLKLLCRSPSCRTEQKNLQQYNFNKIIQQKTCVSPKLKSHLNKNKQCSCCPSFSFFFFSFFFLFPTTFSGSFFSLSFFFKFFQQSLVRHVYFFSLQFVVLFLFYLKLLPSFNVRTHYF